MTDNETKELRLRAGTAILGYIRRFSATEKAVFGLFVIAALVTSVVMAGKVNASFMTEVPAHGGTLREGLIGLPHTVNPILAATDVDRDIASLVYAGLTRYEDGSIVPDLASGWSVSPDGLTYSFVLRPGLTFHDGTPLTAGDVVFTMEKIRDSALKSPRAADWTGVTVTASSTSEVIFRLKQPYSSFLSNTTVGIIPKHIWGSVSDDQFMFSEYNISPVGAGPYRVKDIKRNEGGVPTSYVLSTWGGYHGRTPYLKTIVFSFFADEERALSALASGSIDSLPYVSPAQAAKLASNTGESYKVVTSPLERVFGVFFNQNNNAILAESAVRQALSMSIDREAIIGAILNGYGTPVGGPLPPGLIASSTPAPAPASTTAAQALLEKNGWKIGEGGTYEKKVGKNPVKTLSLTLHTADAPELKQAAEMVRDVWTALGAKVELKIFEPGELYQSIIRTRSYDALLFGQAVGKDKDLYAFWHSSQRNAPGLNVAMYANSKADKLLETIRTASDESARSAGFLEFDEVVRADAPASFLYSPDFIYAVPRSMLGMRLGPITSPADRFASIGGWYLETESVWKIFARDEQP